MKMKSNSDFDIEKAIRDNTRPDGTVDFSKVELPKITLQDIRDIVYVEPTEEDKKRYEDFIQGGGR